MISVASAAAASATSAATPTTGTRSTFSSFVHDHRPTIDVLSVQTFDRSVHRVVRFHFDESKSTGAPRDAVHNDFGGTHRAVLIVHRLQVRRRRGPGLIAHIQPLNHLKLSFHTCTKRNKQTLREMQRN